MAFEELLLRYPELRGRVKLLQMAVPSRTRVETYRDYRHQVHTLIGRINGALGTPDWASVHYIHRNQPPEEVISLYRTADVTLVTPLRDGMNLVAKEFVASRVDEDGVLVLSEFAGAASELAEAVPVNPYDIEGTAEAYHRALVMPDEERRSRMRALRSRVLTHDVARWSRPILETLRDSGAVRSLRPGASDPSTIDHLRDRPAGPPPSCCCSTTTAPWSPSPRPPTWLTPTRRRWRCSRCWPPAPTPRCTSSAAARGRRSRAGWGTCRSTCTPNTASGRGPPVVRPGPTSRPPRAGGGRVLAIFQDYAGRTPASLVEEKASGLAWHYRAADPEFGAKQANELRVHLQEILSNEEVLLRTWSLISSAVKVRSCFGA